MEALQSYASDSESSESDTTQTKKKSRLSEAEAAIVVGTPRLEGPRSPTGDASSLPPPPPDLLNASNSSCVQITDAHCRRVRNFPHVEGNFALHVYIPVPLSSIAKRKLEPLMKKALSISPELEPMDIDSPSHSTHACMSHELKLAKEYHISLSRTVPIRIHQIDSIVAMLRHNFESQKGYWLELDQWEVFVNDDQTRSFLSLEVLDRGSSEICRQIHSVNKIFKLHNLPTYYEMPRPHVSVAWALGNATPSLTKVVEELHKLKTSGEAVCSLPLWSHLVNKIECKIGSQIHCIWKAKMRAKAGL